LEYRTDHRAISRFASSSSESGAPPFGGMTPV
jgi:hypothetical protein